MYFYILLEKVDQNRSSFFYRCDKNIVCFCSTFEKSGKSGKKYNHNVNMPYGNFYYGKTGFFFKKSGAIGNRRNPSLGAICNQPQDVNNRYVPGSGVGASGIAQRRAKLIQAYRTVPQSCRNGPERLGVFAQGGSNMYALNWSLYSGCK